MDVIENAGVFNLITELCSRTALQYSSNNNISETKLIRRMRSLSYELILKSSTVQKESQSEPITDILQYYFILQSNVKNVAQYKRASTLKEHISKLKESTKPDNKQHINNILKLLFCLKDTVNEDLSMELFQNPFSFGLLDEMLPRMPCEVFGSPLPYQYYPSHVFELPYSLKQNVGVLKNQPSLSYMEYTVETFDSLLFLPTNNTSTSDTRTFMSPMSISSLSSSVYSPYSDNNGLMLPRLTTPRDLVIPGSVSSKSRNVNVRVSFPCRDVQSELNEVYIATSRNASLEIWEIASQIDKDIPDDIWEIVSKMPPINERRLISSSIREVSLWHQIYRNVSQLNIVSEKQFIRHIMYLTIGVETSTFLYNNEAACFFMKHDVVLEGISKECIQGYVTNLLLMGTYYRRLYNFAFNQLLDDSLYGNGLIYESARDVVRRYLLQFRLKATEIYEDSFSSKSEGINCIPTLLQILHHLEPIKYEIETVAAIYKMNQSGPSTTIPCGAQLMSYLFNEISLITHRKTAVTMFNALFSICDVYFKFIERFIFEGELDDVYQEFFIKKDSRYVNIRSKRYWDKGFHIIHNIGVPEFLKELAKCILLCGKTLRLLKLCNPNDPLVVLISSDHPSVKCCSNFEKLEHQQQVLDVYRTRCLFVSGEPASFEQILLNKEAERKAFAEMASIKQAETMEKIIAERKRFAQLIIAEKQHSLKVLEAAMAEAKAAKSRNKQRDKRKTELENKVQKSQDELDAKLRDEEKKKIMEYYSKLNMAVEKTKIHSEWKIKRLQLDQSRVQLLSTEERNLRREKLELQYQRNEDVMAMSIQSLGEKSDEDNNELKFSDEIELESNDNINVFNDSYNANSKTTNKAYDNQLKLDTQGNFIGTNVEHISSVTNIRTNKDVIDADSEVQRGENEYLSTRLDAKHNRDRVMSHKEFILDTENNAVNISPSENISTFDRDNNVPIYDQYKEAKQNKIKVLGSDFGEGNVMPNKVFESRTEAHKQALLNKQKVLGVEYNVEKAVTRTEPVTEAQEQAALNRNKVLGSENSFDPIDFSCKRQSLKRSALTLNLKPCEENASYKSISNAYMTPNAGGVTPAEYFPRLDLETPTTADNPLGNFPQTNESNTPISNAEFLNSSGFNFDTLIVDEEAGGDMCTFPISDNDLSDESYGIIDKIPAVFDPFGINHIKSFSRDSFEDEQTSFYSHPADIMREVQKKPYANIFRSKNDKEELQNVGCDNIATLTACLQRSVMLPLTYQLEVVNNSILTHFLVNLDMYEHLRSLKDYFFLMDGEFSKNICHNLFAKLVKTINPQDLLNFSTLNNILDKALGSSISHVHKFSENLSFNIAEPPLSFQHSSPDVLQCLTLTYSVNWPLNIILSQETISRYSMVFQFLLKMRRISWVLGQDFESLKTRVRLARNESRILLRSPQYRSVQIYRHVMAALIRALDNYIVTTCILTSWTEFENDLKRARTLDDLYDCHVTYIKKVLFRCLLNNRSTPVMKILNNIFTIILKFSRVLKSGVWHRPEESNYFVHTNFNQLDEFFHLFEKLTKYLHKVVNRFMEFGYQRHLVELLTMINLNGYYDLNSSKDKENTSITSNQ